MLLFNSCGYRYRYTPPNATPTSASCQAEAMTAMAPVRAMITATPARSDRRRFRTATGEWSNWYDWKNSTSRSDRRYSICMLAPSPA